MDAVRLEELTRNRETIADPSVEKRQRANEPEPSFRRAIMALVPNLRAFAISLTRNGDRADDLVQETILRAWAKNRMFVRGTNLNAWLFTILRNAYYSEYRKRAREVKDDGGISAARLTSLPAQQDRLNLQDLWSALDRIPVEQREALILVGAESLSYDEAAAICGCAVGTVKSRVNRGRNRLAELLDYERGDFASDAAAQSVLIGNGVASPPR